MSAKTTLAEQLALIAEHAPHLRKAGVTSFTAKDCSFTLAPYLEPGPTQQTKADAVEEEPVDPLDDPMTFGRRTGVPGFPRRKRAEDEEPQP